MPPARPPAGRVPRAARVSLTAAVLVLAAAGPLYAQPAAPPGELGVLPIPGGAWALAELGVPDATERASALRVLLRRLADTPSGEAANETLARVQAQVDLAVRVEEAARAAAPDYVLSLASARSRPQRDRVRAAVEAFGGRLRERRNQFTVELDDSRRGRDVQAALKTIGLDVAALASRLNAGEGVPILVPSQDVPLPLSAATWAQVVFNRSLPPRALFAELLRDPAALYLYYGLVALDAPTRRFLEVTPDLLRQLHRDAASVFGAYGAAFAVQNGRVQIAGSAAIAPLWEALLGAPVSDPLAFARRLFTQDGGRLAVFFDLMQQLPGAHREFAAGTWIADAGLRRDRFRALYAAVAASDPQWSPRQAPFTRFPADPWLLLRGLALDARGQAPAGPRQRRFWERAFEAGLPPDPVRALRDVEDGGVVDAAWLVEQVCHVADAERARRFHQVMLVPRLFPAPAAADLPAVLTAARGVAEYPALFLVLERMDVVTPRLAAQLTAQATRVDRVEDRNRRALALLQFQGAVALVDRLRWSGAVTADSAGALLAALASLPVRQGVFGGGVAAWLVDRVGSMLARGDATLEDTVIQALAPVRRAPLRVRVRAAPYDVDVAGAERARLTLLRRAQAGLPLDQVAATLQLQRVVGQGMPSAEKARDDARAIAELEKALGRPRALPDFTEPVELSRVLPQARRELERVRGPRDADHVERAQERLGQATEWLTAHALLSLAYTPHLGEAASLTARPGDPSLRHRLGVHEASDDARRTMPWTLPSEADAATGAVAGAVLGLDHALAHLALRRAAGGAAPTATPLPGPVVQGLALQAVLARPEDAAGVDLTAISTALARGRTVVARAVADPSALDTAAATARLDADRRAVLRWMAEHEPARVPAMFSVAELAVIGGLTDPPPALGPPALAVDGRLRLASRSAEPWTPYFGRPTLALMSAVMPDLALRLAECMDTAGVPAALFPALAAFAAQDIVDAAAPATSDDWMTISRQVAAIGQERLGAYLTALTTVGVLRPALSSP